MLILILLLQTIAYLRPCPPINIKIIHCWVDVPWCCTKCLQTPLHQLGTMCDNPPRTWMESPKKCKLSLLPPWECSSLSLTSPYLFKFLCQNHILLSVSLTCSLAMFTNEKSKSSAFPCQQVFQVDKYWISGHIIIIIITNIPLSYFISKWVFFKMLQRSYLMALID